MGDSKFRGRDWLLNNKKKVSLMKSASLRNSLKIKMRDTFTHMGKYQQRELKLNKITKVEAMIYSNGNKNIMRYLIKERSRISKYNFWWNKTKKEFN